MRTGAPSSSVTPSWLSVRFEPSVLIIYCSVSCPSLHTQIACCGRPCQNRSVPSLSPARCVRSAIRHVSHVLSRPSVGCFLVQVDVVVCRRSPVNHLQQAVLHRRTGTTVAPSVVNTRRYQSRRYQVVHTYYIFCCLPTYRIYLFAKFELLFFLYCYFISTHLFLPFVL